MGEWFMDNGMDALIVYDDLSKHAVAYRQVSLVLKRPSGREAYPGDVFYLHSRLLERSARVGGEVRQRFADRAADHRNAGRRRFGLHPDQRHLDHRRPDLSWKPTCSIKASVRRSRSVSRCRRVGSAAQIKAMKQVAGRIKGDLAQFRELAAFAQFGSDLDAKTQAKIDRGKRIVEIFKQPQYNPIPVEIQVAMLWTVQNGYVDEVAGGTHQGLPGPADRVPVDVQGSPARANRRDESARR